MKVFILGAQCSGKTSLVAYLHTAYSIAVEETEDELTRLNDGVWPSIEKQAQLLPGILQSFAHKKEAVFVHNHMSVEDVRMLKQAGFTTVLLQVEPAELLRRNTVRMREQGYSDIRGWVERQLQNISQLQRLGLIDYTINAQQPIEQVASEVINIINTQ